MSEYQIAKRYAKAALQSAEEKKLTQAFITDFQFLEECVKSSKDLLTLFKNPIVSKNKKLSITDALFKGSIHTETLGFISFLINKDRISILPNIINAFFDLKNEQYGIIKAELLSFHPLEKIQTELIKKNLEDYTKKKIELEPKIDKEIMGGLVVKIGDTVFDGSLKRRLELLKEHLQKPN
jgi:F-type H+-transporting ATPase subunit delta